VQHLQSLPFSLAQGDTLRLHGPPQPSMKADISTLLKPDILILRLHKRFSTLTSGQLDD
jgi:hypothetical protein